MAVTLEQVEKLREKAKVSYEEAKAVLERHDGDLLEALIELERQGRSNTAGQGGFYTTRPQGAPQAEALIPTAPSGGKSGKRGQEKKGRNWNTDGAGVAAALRDLVQRSISNQVEVWRGDRMMTSIPVLILILLVVFFFWITLPLLIVGLIFGYRYRFSGPDLGRESVNRVMDQVSETVEDVRRNVEKEFGRKK